MNDILQLNIRRKIYTLLQKNPGLHARKIAKLLTLQGQLIDYHLLYMEKYGVISSVKEEGYRRYYIAGKLGMKERQHIAILRRETPLKIVLFLLKNPHARYDQLLEHLQISKSTLSYHLQKLLKTGIIEITRIESKKGYIIKEEETIIKLLIQYKPYSRMESMKDTWVDLKWPKK